MKKILAFLILGFMFSTTAVFAMASKPNYGVPGLNYYYGMRDAKCSQYGNPYFNLRPNYDAAGFQACAKPYNDYINACVNPTTGVLTAGCTVADPFSA